MYFIYAWTYAYGIFFPFDPTEESQPYVTHYRDADRDCLFLRWRSNLANKTSKMDGELIYADGGKGNVFQLLWDGEEEKYSLKVFNSEIKTSKEACTHPAVDWNMAKKPTTTRQFKLSKVIEPSPFKRASLLYADPSVWPSWARGQIWSWFWIRILVDLWVMFWMVGIVCVPALSIRHGLGHQQTGTIFASLLPPNSVGRSKPCVMENTSNMADLAQKHTAVDKRPKK